MNLLLQAKDPDVLALLPELEAAVDEALGVAAASPERTPPPPVAAAGALPPSWRPVQLPRERMVDNLRAALDDLMRRRDDVVMIGQDIESPYGGAFKVTDSLSDRHPGRVLNTPISEAAIVGTGTGVALKGGITFVEIMFGDFVTLAADQLMNHAAKLAFLGAEGDPVVDVVVRTPMGGGRGYGPTHSQTLEKMFFGVPGIRVIALNDLVPPQQIIEAIGRGGLGPTLLVENKALYGRSMGAGMPVGFQLVHSGESLPTAWLRPARSPDVTLLGYGGRAVTSSTRVVNCSATTISSCRWCARHRSIRCAWSRCSTSSSAHRCSSSWRRVSGSPASVRRYSPSWQSGISRRPSFAGWRRPNPAFRPAGTRSGPRYRVLKISSGRCWKRWVRAMFDIRIEQINANDATASLTCWLVETGASVTEGQPVALVETSKVSIEVESPFTGYLARVAAVGDALQVGDLVAQVCLSAEEAVSSSTARPDPVRATVAGIRAVLRLRGPIRPGTRRAPCRVRSVRPGDAWGRQGGP